MDLLSICGENNTNLLLIYSEALSDDFFKLRTGVAGMMLQKFVNYHIKTAVIIGNEQIIKGKFQDMLSESNKGNNFRTFDSITEAEKWLFGLN